jgi:type I restriction enzyme S subunit
MILITVPLPPCAVQDQIVAKVNHLMALCDDLEAKLRSRDEKAAKLAEALVAEVAG